MSDSPGIRIARVLAAAGAAARRGAEELIRQGLVTVNGRLVTTPATLVDPAKDAVSLRGKLLRRPAPRTYVLLNKPRGYVCTRHDEKGRPTVLELLPSKMRHLYPVGRLDLDSEGLLVLTDDGDLCLKLTHPRFGARKQYRVRVRGVPAEATLERLRRGVSVDGERMRVQEVKLSRHGENSWLDVTLTEGKRNELRRLLSAVGHRVVRLKRIAVEFLTLEGVPSGKYRPLSEAEVKRLAASAGRRSENRGAASTPRKKSRPKTR